MTFVIGLYSGGRAGYEDSTNPIKLDTKGEGSGMLDSIPGKVDFLADS